MKRAILIGSGPNGLAAAIVLAQAGLAVEVFEAESEPGGACRSLPLTLPGFHHDLGQPFTHWPLVRPFSKLFHWRNHGLEWVHGEAPVAHPLDDGTAVVLEREPGRRREGTRRRWPESGGGSSNDSLAAGINWPKARSARSCAFPATPSLWRGLVLLRCNLPMASPLAFPGVRVRALLAGLAAHSILPFDRPFSSSAAMLLGAAAHAVGWPIPQGGAGAIPRALIGHLQSLGGVVHTSRRIDAQSFRDLTTGDTLTLCDTAPGALLALAGDRLVPGYRKTIQSFEHAPGAFKVDYALTQPVPWRAAACRRAITVHLGGTFEEIAAGEDAVAHGLHPDQPFVLAAQPTLFDPSRAPEGKHVLWAYCHVPNGSTIDMTNRIEAQIERFAPGFRDCILARRAFSPAGLEAMDANLVGGDISGGAFTVRQILFRPHLRGYSTGTPNLYLCSASTPPGGAVHGMCGFHAARLALARAGPLVPK